MAYPTVEQKDALASLREQYGEPDLVFIEVTSDAYGVMRVEWRGDPVFRTTDRTLFVRPDGTRLCWTLASTLDGEAVA